MQQLPELPSLWWMLTLLPLGVLTWRRPAWLPAVFFVAGVAWASLRAGIILADSLPRELEGQDILVTGHVADIPRRTDFGLQFEFDVEAAEQAGTGVRLPSRILLSGEEGLLAPRAAERWRLAVRLKRPHGFRNPGGFDYEAHLFRKRLRATGYVRPAPPPQRLEGTSAGYAVQRLRQALGERIQEALPGHAFAGMVTALANGDSRAITAEQWEVLRASGTVHLMAISGLHISLVAGMVFFLACFLWSLPGQTVLRVPAPVFAAACGLVAAAGYAALAGFTIPTQRAFIMLAVAMGGVFLRRRFPPSQVLAAALLMVLVHDPLAVMASGFWLSFAAVAVIVFVLHAEPGKRPLWHFGYLQWAIALGMLPPMAALFGQVSLTAPLANMLAVPLFGFLVVPLTLCGAALLPLFMPLATVALQFAAALIDWLWPALGLLGRLEYSQWILPTPPVWALAAAVAGTALLLAPRGFPARWVGAVWMLPVVLVRTPVPAEGELWFTLLDVGQGLAAVVRTREHTLVFDTGARFSSGFDAGRAVVVPYLRAVGVRRIDTLVVSHGDNDHRGGAQSVLRALPVARVLASEPVLSPFAEHCREGQAWRWDGVTFTMLNPAQPESGVSGAQDRRVAAARSAAGRGAGKIPNDRRQRTGRRAADNDASCVLVVRSRHGAVLLPGDIEARAETRLVERYGEALAAEVLVAPHHGSKTSSSEAFVAAVRPRHVLFPVGYRNRYRHPHPEVVERYLRAGSMLHGSPASGALELRLYASGIEVHAFRREHRRYWHTTMDD